MARPKKDAAEKRDERKNLRFTLAEMEEIRVAAAEKGLDVSEYLRQRCLNGQARPSMYRKGIDPALVTEINELGLQVSRLGNLAMQIARNLNSDRKIKNPESWAQLPDLIQDNQKKVAETLKRVVTGQ